MTDLVLEENRHWASVCRHGDAMRKAFRLAEADALEAAAERKTKQENVVAFPQPVLLQ